MVPYESYVELAERLLAVTPISGPKKAAFFNSGAEAVENAVKLAKLATGRSAVITFERAFHGRTLMAMSLTSKQHPYKAGMGPFAPEVYRAPLPVRLPRRARRRRRDGARRAARDVHHPRRARERRRDHLRAGAGRGRLHRAAGRVGAGPARDRRRARHRADRRRGAVGLRPHRPHVRDRALRRRARHHHRRQVDRRRRAHLGRARPGRDRRRGRATARSAARTSARRWAAWPASPCWTRSSSATCWPAARAIGERMRSRFEAMQAAHPQIGDVRGLGPMLALEFVTRPGRPRSRRPSWRRRWPRARCSAG